MIKTYTYKIKPKKKIEQKFNHWVGICRYVYNTAKELKETYYQNGISLSSFDIQKQLTDAKKEHTFLKDVHSQTLQAVVERMDNSFKRFFKGAGYPKWASKKKWKSIPFKSIKTTHNAFKLPSFGIVKVFNFKEPKGVLKTATIIREVDGLYLKVVVDEYSTKVTDRDSQSVVALDMGIKFFYVTSDGEFISNPKHLSFKLSELRVQQRKLSRMKKGGSNWKKQIKLIQMLHLKVKRSRLDFLQKQSTIIANDYANVIVEDLNIKGMSKNNKLSKHILDCGWGTFSSLLEYKTNVIRVDPKYSSQECNECGHISKDNRKTQSLFKCVSCGYTENADYQATLNLFQRGQALMEVNVNY